MVKWVKDPSYLCGGACSIPCPMQWVKDPVLLQPWHGLQLWLRFDPHGSFHMPRGQPKKKKKIITILLTIFLVLFITSHGLFITGGLYLLIFFTYFAPSTLLLSGNHCLVLWSMFLLHLFVLSFRFRIEVRSNGIYLSLFDLFHSRFIRVVPNGKTEFFLWLSNIPLCVCYIGKYIYHILFHSSIHGHFHILALVNNAAMNF